MPSLRISSASCSRKSSTSLSCGAPGWSANTRAKCSRTHDATSVRPHETVRLRALRRAATMASSSDQRTQVDAIRRAERRNLVAFALVVALLDGHETRESRGELIELGRQRAVAQVRLDGRRRTTRLHDQHNCRGQSRPGDGLDQRVHCPRPAAHHDDRRRHVAASANGRLGLDAKPVLTSPAGNALLLVVDKDKVRVVLLQLGAVS
eukprot:675604-Prymnesium_polylepis.1